MHECIIDKTCIDRIIEHNTNCFHKKHIIESFTCRSGLALGINIKILHITGHCVNRILYSDMACCRTDNCDFYSHLHISVSPLNMQGPCHWGSQNGWAALCLCDRAAGNL